MVFFQWPFQDLNWSYLPFFEADFLGLNFREYPHKIWYSWDSSVAWYLPSPQHRYHHQATRSHRTRCRPRKELAWHHGVPTSTT